MSRLLRKKESEESDKKETAKTVFGIVLFGFSGWFMWNTFMAEPEPTPLPSSSQVVPAPVMPPPAPEPVKLVKPAKSVKPIKPIEPVETVEDLMATAPEELIDESLVAIETPEAVDDSLDPVSLDAQQAAIDTHDLVIEQLDESCDTTGTCVDNPESEVATLAVTSMPNDKQQEKHQHPLTERSYLDARECLDLADNMAIHRCAEKYR